LVKRRRRHANAMAFPVALAELTSSHRSTPQIKAIRTGLTSSGGCTLKG
jgi:hypothetical protein